jgi:hypothetical protein
MPALMKVFRGVAPRRIVAATNVSARETQAQVHPPPAGGQAFFASRRRPRLNGCDLGNVRAKITVHLTPKVQ